MTPSPFARTDDERRVAAGLAYAVVLLTVQLGRLPVVSLVLAFSFGFYGLLRKTARVEAMSGLMLETTLMLPVAIGYLLWLQAEGTLAYGRFGWTTDVLLPVGGLVTALPLLWYTNAARRLDYTTRGRAACVSERSADEEGGHGSEQCAARLLHPRTPGPVRRGRGPASRGDLRRGPRVPARRTGADRPTGPHS